YNSYNVVQEGTVSFLLTSLKDEELSRNSTKVKIGKHATDNYSLSIPNPKKPGFYKLSVMVNVTEYDDTLKRVLGVNVKDIVSDSPKPKDFDDFWANSITELSHVKPKFKMTEQPVLEQNGISVYLIECKSYGNLTIRGWLTIPKKRKPNTKLPVWYVLPGYGGKGVQPIYANQDLAVLSFNVRGQGNSRDIVHPTPDGYVTTDIENKDKYIMRGAIMDCIRGIDFICSRPELDSTNIICSGGSMGGYLSIITSSLDPRIKLCSANNPVWSDWRSLNDPGTWPLSALVKYSKAKYIPMKRLLDNLDYYDLKNFSPNLECKSLIGISLLDNLAPPYNQYTMLNSIKGEYKLFVYPNLTHEVPPSLFTYLSKWMMDEFGMF
ncbi:MAG: hypothetical protein EOP47_20810, partial [Sphingobacteriaceae bacterium]